MRLVECVPNFSGPFEPMAEAMAAVPGCAVLDASYDADHNRSVVTCAGEPDALLDASVRAAAAARDSIDIRVHAGVHPRIGAIDVLPFIPLAGCDLSDCARLAHAAGERIWREIGIPAYYYEAAAVRQQCRNLAELRRLAGTIPPDTGGPEHHATAGAVAIGARFFLIAFNAVLDTGEVNVAKAVAAAVRESGGGLRSVKALGLALPLRGLVQVSMNLVDYRVTPPAAALEAVERLAAQRSARVIETELIGLAPRAATLPEWSADRILENRLAAAGFVLP